MPLLFFGLVFSVLISILWLIWSVVVLVAAAAFLFWPIALLTVAALLLRGQMRFWQRMTSATAATPLRERPAREWGAAPSRNAAFEEYRKAALNRLDEETGRFREFLERMRKSRDKQEFDRYMAERRSGSAGGVVRNLPAV